jgi:hypothetical protein
MKRFILAVMLMFASTMAVAGDNFFELGADVQTYGSSFSDISDLDTSLALNARLGSVAGFYGFGSYEQPDLNVLAQDVGKFRMFGAGVGYRLAFADNWYFLAEGAYYMPSTSNNLNSVVDYDNDWGVAAGLGYDINEHFTLNTKYRYLKMDQNDTVGDDRVDLSAFSVGLSYRF